MELRKAFGGRENMRNAIRALLVLAVSASLFTGCGNVGSAPSVLTGSTTVLVLRTSTANDMLAKFYVGLSSMTLTSTAGNSVTLYNNASGSGPGEWMHLNGAAEPLVTLSVPQGTYTSATVKAGSCSFVIFSTQPTGQELQSTISEPCGFPASGSTTVDLPNPITISGTGMALSLDLQVPQSYTVDISATPVSYTTSPVFTLTPLALASPPTNILNGKMGPVQSQITSINTAASSFVAQTTDGVSIAVLCDDSTTYQGIDGLSSLLPDMLVDMDLAVQPDASLLATRVEAQDAASPMVVIGPITYGPNLPQSGDLIMLPIQSGLCYTANPPYCNNEFQYFSNTLFGVSGQFSNVQSLPFAPNFSASSLFLGQNISAYTPGTFSSPDYEGITTLDLAPQTIDGTVTAISETNGFTAYTVALAPYDAITTLAQSLVATDLLTNPNTIAVYADADTQLLNTSNVYTGGVTRFTGLVFDVNGALFMDCSQILDGVPE